jgi:integrase
MTASSNVNLSKVEKSTSNHYRFGENLHYLTEENLQSLWDVIDDYTHKLWLRLIYELGCRVGEFVQIRLRHINFRENAVFFPAENTKIGQRRTCYLPQGLMNELKSYLKDNDMMTKREERIRDPDAYLLPSTQNRTGHLTTRRLQHIFKKYVEEAGLQEIYGHSSSGKPLYKYTIHSLRHSHIRHYVKRVPLAAVQRQAGHKSLQTTEIYLRLTDEDVKRAYEEAR